MTDNATDAALVSQMLLMSEADLSTLRAALSRPEPLAQRTTAFGRKRDEVLLGTAQGSANDKLWSLLKLRGWLEERTLPGVPDLGTKTYALLTEGRNPIGQLLAKRDSVLSARVSAMSKVHDEKVLPFVADLVSSVKAAGGDGWDIATLTALLVKRVVQQIADSDKHEAVIQQITNQARHTAKREAQVN